MMIDLFICLLLCGFLNGSLGQVPDYETTPFFESTSFSCIGRQPGYYADLESGCKTYHVCDGNSHFTYICPRNTLFQQRGRVCDHSYLVRCEDSIYYYEGEDYPVVGEDQSFVLEEPEDSRFVTGQDDELGTTTVLLTSTETIEIPSKQPIQSTTSITSTTSTAGKTDAETSTVSIVPSNTRGYLKGFSSTEKFLKLTLKDSRWLFYIPEFDNNSIVTKNDRQLLLPIEGDGLMKFKNRTDIAVRNNGSLPRCPGYCNPKFFRPGTCHPCLMIK